MNPNDKLSPVLRELRPLGPAYGVLLGFSLFLAIIFLAAPLFAEQVMDRVVSSRSISTLVALTVIALFMMAIYSVLDVVRRKALGRIGIEIDQRLSRRLFDALHRSSSVQNKSVSTSLIADFNIVRDFLSGPNVLTVMDALWSPVFIFIMALVHWVFVVMAVVVWGLSAALSIMNERLSRQHTAQYQRASQSANEFGIAVARNTESVRALGMIVALRRRWYDYHSAMLGWRDAGGDRTRLVGGILLFIRNSQMILLFSVGGYLYIIGEMNFGGLLVLSMAMSRGITPILGVVTNWAAFTGFAASYSRLNGLFATAEKRPAKISLHDVSGTLSVQRVFATPPGEERIILNDVTFALPQGRVLGVVGPNGAGKSCLARVLVGVWQPRRGTVSLGDHDLSHVDEDALGRRLGYLAQEVELLPGTIAENIARFEPDFEMADVIAAAEMIGIQELIRSLPEGYNTKVGPSGHVLSGGQRHRIALARAVYGEPRLIVLDEPNANLDAQGEQALATTIQKLQSMSITVVVVTHKMNLLNYCDDILVLNAGTVQAFGSRELIASRMPRLKPAPALSVIQGTLKSTGADR
ncbi:type I secretion system permease/ATPase [Terrihabitans rhizophilus]|uniref:Type I secretion system permease/ATPase n=1 Tax=Terrihabitans rhizophilus TaxID=3092662 RepID=A0ABU4RQ66_9HYPH|nr:type I secretion system permease/ATPase [Terrihabitans sp. PJ23]MDX6805770.1 type I secretion system permease/ATPase [Terrihabitans sp. PJ23]